MNMLKEIPKVNLHLHLDGSIRIKTTCELTNMDIKQVKKLMIASKCDSLDEYLTKFTLANEIMQTKENLTRIAKELVLDLKKEHVIYAEVRFAPLLHIKKGLSPKEVVDSVLRGLNDNEIKVNLILCMMRHFNFEENLKTIELARKYLNKGVVALDLAGDEALYNTSSFKELFQIIKKKDIPFTIHAGEAAGVDSILSAISFGAKRIGHGVRCIEDKRAISLIKQKGITLEVCPKSNVDTNIYKYNNHPIKKLYEEGVLVTINTDNQTVSDITLTKEYKKLIKYFNFKLEDFKKMNINAINSAFIESKEKEKYYQIINDYFNK